LRPGPEHLHRAVLDRQHHRLLLGQSEFLRLWVIGEVVGGRLLRRPFAQVAFVEPARGGQLRDRHRPLRLQRLVETDGIADADQSNARGAAEIAEHLADKLVQLVFVHFRLQCSSHKYSSIPKLLAGLVDAFLSHARFSGLLSIVLLWHRHAAHHQILTLKIGTVQVLFDGIARHVVGPFFDLDLRYARRTAIKQPLPRR
jgi:hypothetical protein